MSSKSVRPIWRFLGEPSISSDGSDLTPMLGKKQIALLAYLALAREGASRDEVATKLWPGSDADRSPDPARSRHNLRQSLVSLRKAFGAGFDAIFDVSDDRISLNHSAIEIDVLRLLQIGEGQAASTDELIDLCRGPFLRSIVTRAAEFDDWIETQRDHLSHVADRPLRVAFMVADQTGRMKDAAGVSAAMRELGMDPPPVPGAEVERTEVQPAVKRIRRWARSVGVGIGAVAVALAGLWGAYSVSPQFRNLANTYIDSHATPPRIAVLPFTARNNAPEEAGLAGSVTLGVNYALYAITAQELFVVTPISQARQLGQLELVRFAKKLRVRYLIAGAVEVVDGMVRVFVECLDAERRTIIWQQQFDKPMAQAFKLQDDITLEILKRLDIELSTAEWNRIQYLDDTENLYAWLAAANGVRHLIKVKRRDVEIARRSYLKALEYDPNYVSAMRGLAWIQFLKVRLGWTDDVEAAVLEATDKMQTVLRRAPDDGTTKSLQGAVLLLAGDYDNAVLAGERAVELLPGSADATAVLAHTLTYVGEHERALVLIERAMELSPMHPAWYRWTKGRALRMTGRLEDSVAELERTLDGPEQTIVQLVELTASYSAAGQMDKARASAMKIKSLDPNFSASRWLRHPRIKVEDIQLQEYELLAKAGL